MNPARATEPDRDLTQSVVAGKTVQAVVYDAPVAVTDAPQMGLTPDELRNGAPLDEREAKTLLLNIISGGIDLSCLENLTTRDKWLPDWETFHVPASNSPEELCRCAKSLLCNQVGCAPQAYAILRYAASLNSPEAECELGRLRYNGGNIGQDWEEAASHFIKAARQRHPVAQRYIGVMLLKGDWPTNHWPGFRRDVDKAIRWLRRAAEQNDSKAQGLLGQVLLHFSHANPVLVKEALTNLLKSASAVEKPGLQTSHETYEARRIIEDVYDEWQKTRGGFKKQVRYESLVARHRTKDSLLAELEHLVKTKGTNYVFTLGNYSLDYTEFPWNRVNQHSRHI